MYVCVWIGVLRAGGGSLKRFPSSGAPRGRCGLARLAFTVSRTRQGSARVRADAGDAAVVAELIRDKQKAVDNYYPLVDKELVQ